MCALCTSTFLCVADPTAKTIWRQPISRKAPISRPRLVSLVLLLATWRCNVSFGWALRKLHLTRLRNKQKKRRSSMTRAKPSIKCAENERLCHYQAHPVGRAGRRKNTRVSIGVRVFCCSSGYDLRADSLSASAKNVSGPLFFFISKKVFSA